jgi:hypothetical protein
VRVTVGVTIAARRTHLFFSSHARQKELSGTPFARVKSPSAPTSPTNVRHWSVLHTDTPRAAHYSLTTTTKTVRGFSVRVKSVVLSCCLVLCREEGCSQPHHGRWRRQQPKVHSHRAKLGQRHRLGHQPHRCVSACVCLSSRLQILSIITRRIFACWTGLLFLSPSSSHDTESITHTAPRHSSLC